MALVEEAAAYLDGAGRQRSKLLSRNAALVYAGESMTLTTRLMQVASWLLVQRAVRQGDMTPDEARQPRYRLGAKAASPSAALPAPTGPAEPLPAGLRELADRAARLFERRHPPRLQHVRRPRRPALGRRRRPLPAGTPAAGVQRLTLIRPAGLRPFPSMAR